MNLRTLPAFVVLTTGFVWAQAGGGGGIGASAGAVIHGPNGLKGVPFSADVITESTRTLADGNRIHQETHGKEFRDSEGRTRSETEFPLSPNDEHFQHIFIIDPIQNVHIVLDTRGKTAIVHHFGDAASQARQVLVPKPSSTTKSGAMASLQVLDSPRTEDLGTMEIDGFTAKGTRHTRTIPAGKIGNDQPITSVHEIWMSHVLQVVLLSKTQDPQSGDQTMKLTNIRTTEPDPSLFQIPPDYTVKDDGAPK
jgi:hypothetical protein